MSQRYYRRGGAAGVSRTPGWKHIGPPQPRYRIVNPPARVLPHILNLPAYAIDNIFAELGTRDALVLCATSQFFYVGHLTFYKKIIYDVDDADEHALVRTTTSLSRLYNTLLNRPDIGLAIEAISIRDTGSPLIERFTRRADGIIASILTLTPNLHVFQWLGHTHLRPHCPEQTIVVLRQLSKLKDLRIQGFEAPTDVHHAMQELANVQPDMRSLERVVIRCGGYPVYWFRAFLRNAPALRKLDFVDKQQTVYDIRQYAQSLRRLDTLVLSFTPMVVGSYLGLVHKGLTDGVWTNLMSFSLDTQLTTETLKRMVINLSGCRLRRFRLVVNAFNNYSISGFGPAMIGEVLRHLRYLEELILDQYNMHTYAPLPGSWEDWGTNIRSGPSLRILTMPTYFVLDDVRSANRELQADLAAIAEEFIDIHLRNPNFQEIRFLNTVVNATRHAFVTGTVERNANGEDDHEDRLESSPVVERGREGMKNATTGYRVLRFMQKVDREAEMEGERGTYMAKYLGRQTEADEAEMMFWMPRLLVD